MRKQSDFFGITRYIVREAREQKEVLSEPEAKEILYQEKDFLSINVDNTRGQKQK